MKSFSIYLVLLLLASTVSAQNLKPYIQGLKAEKSIDEIKEELKPSLEANNLKVVGEYQPANDSKRWVIVISSEDLESAVQKVGGLTGFAATLRIALTIEDGKTIVSYTNPPYWGNAYFRSDYTKVATYYVKVNKSIENALSSIGNFKVQPFGSEEGHTAEELRKYHYMMGMPYFDETVELEDFDSYLAAIAKIDASIKKGVPNVKQVYKLTIPNSKLTLYGFALSGEDGENQFMPIIDIGKPKHTAFLPYEVLVMDNEVHMLHGRFRIALAFPDLTMSTFSKIMSTPGNIEDLLEQLVE